MKRFFSIIAILSLCFTPIPFSLFFPPASAQSPPEAIPPVFIKAFNPGYTIDGKPNVGEFIELSRSHSDTPLLLAGFVLSYTNSSGTPIRLFEFPDSSWMTGESILLRLAGSSEPADLEYAKSLAFKAGPLTLLQNEEIIDQVCWTGKDDCQKPFKSSSPTTLVRDQETLVFAHRQLYHPNFDSQNPGYFEEIPANETPPSQCKGLIFSELLSFYETSVSEQFIEFYNPTADQILLNGCQIKYKNHFYPLIGIVKPESYFLRLLPDFHLSKNPTTKNVLELVDINGSIVDTLTYYNGQRKSASYAQIGYDSSGAELWEITYAPTPGAPNHYQPQKSCPAGKALNLETGNCVTPTTITKLVCPPGKSLNPDTGRCRLNKETLPSSKSCQPGYELNPATGRCRKIRQNTGADLPLTSESYTESSSFIAYYAVLGVVIVGIAYIIYEYRLEIKKFFGKVFRRVR